MTDNHDKYLNDLLFSISSSDIYFYKEPKTHKELIRYRKGISYLETELHLIRQAFKNELIFDLTPKGRTVIKKGGWIKYCEWEDKVEKNKVAKEDYDLKISRLQANTSWFPYLVSAIGIGISIWALCVSN